MIRRVLALLLLAWLLGGALFALTLPGPKDGVRTDGAVVLTGGPGRTTRGVAVLQRGWTKRVLVSGVDQTVRPGEFKLVHGVPAQLMACCIELGKQATDTVSNADETAAWVKRYKLKSVRLITQDWHMRRARLELEHVLDDDVAIVPDGVRSQPSLKTIAIEYHKYLARRISVLFGR